MKPAKAKFNYCDALEKSFRFYRAQRSGKLPLRNGIPWRKNSALQDGADVGRDLTGGYYDAGDHVKFAFPMASSMTLLSWGVVEYRDAYQRCGQLNAALDAIKWGTDWLLKAHTAPNELYGQVGLGEVDHAYWGPAETMTMPRPAFKIDAQNPGSDLAGEAAATLAAASIAFRPSNPTYANRLLQHAIQLFYFADTYRGKYSDSIPDAAKFYKSWGGYNDELVWSAIWLHRAMKAAGQTTSPYLAKAESYYQTISPTRTQSWDDKSYGGAILLAQETGKTRYKTDVETWLNYWTDKSGGGIRYTPGGLAWLEQWGSLRYTANTAFLAGIYSDTVLKHSIQTGGSTVHGTCSSTMENTIHNRTGNLVSNTTNKPSNNTCNLVQEMRDRYSNFAAQQLHYILGDNPNQRSYVIGFGKNPPRNPHHRSAHGSLTGNINDPPNNRHILYGALVGGPSKPEDNAYNDDRSDYISNEVALDYNAGFTGILVRTYHLGVVKK
jgi:endoglucanase